MQLVSEDNQRTDGSSRATSRRCICRNVVKVLCETAKQFTVTTLVRGLTAIRAGWHSAVLAGEPKV